MLTKVDFVGSLSTYKLYCDIQELLLPGMAQMRVEHWLIVPVCGTRHSSGLDHVHDDDGGHVREQVLVVNVMVRDPHECFAKKIRNSNTYQFVVTSQLRGVRCSEDLSPNFVHKVCQVVLTKFHSHLYPF